jgi:hypothetical protein
MTRIATQAVSLSLALLITAVTLASLNGLAAGQHSAALQAAVASARIA